jgi:hypothetical protein
MRRFGRPISLVLAWLAAGLSLLAGVPYVACACDIANVTPATGTAAPSGMGCCCEGNCPFAPRGAAGSGHKPCCCRRPSGGQVASVFTVPMRADTAVGAHCVRAVYQPEAPSLTRTDSAPRPDVSGKVPAVALLAPAHPAHSPRSSVAHGRTPTHSLAPPDDLVVLLQHLLI